MKARQKGFTLIELLVVISVIAVLMGILIPALRRVKAAAQRVVCMTNLHSYGLATSIYQSDNDSKFQSCKIWLHDGYTQPAGNPEVCRWHDPGDQPNGTLWPYLKGKDTHICPSFSAVGKINGCPFPGHDPDIPIDPQFNYTMNGYLGYFDPKGLWSPLTFGGVLKATHVKRAASTIVFMGENVYPLNKGSGYHQNLAGNYGADDDYIARWPIGSGKGAGFTREDFPPGNYADCIATYHKTSLSKWEEGAGNVVFLDGHVDTVDPHAEEGEVYSDVTFDLSWPK